MSSNHPAPPPDAPLGGTAQPPPSATGTPARTLADELHDLAMSMPVNGQSFRAAINCGKTPAIIYKIAHRDACYDIAVALAAHPALCQPAPVAADGAGQSDRQWGILRNGQLYGETFISRTFAEEVAATLDGARVVPVRVSVLADDAGAEASGLCWYCSRPMTRNPHPNAGKPGALLEVGAVFECIPCLARTRHVWATWARKADAARAAAEGEATRLREGIAESLAMVDEAYQATGYVKVAKTSEQRLRLAALVAPAGGAGGRDGKA